MLLAFLKRLELRIYLRLKVLKIFRGLTLGGRLNLWIFALIDSLLYAFSN